MILVDRLFVFGLIACIALSPLPLGSNRPATWSLLAAGVGGMVVLWGLVAALRPSLFRLSGVPALLPMALWLPVILWLLVQTGGPEFAWHPLWFDTQVALGLAIDGAISVSPVDTGTSAMKLLCYGGLFWIACQTGRDPDNARVLLNAVVVVAVLYALYGLVAEFAGGDTILWYKKWAYVDALTSTFVNRNSFATYCGIGIVTAAGLGLQAWRHDDGDGSALAAGRRSQTIILYAAAASVLLVALIFTHSRAGLLSTALGTGAIIWCYTSRMRQLPGTAVLAGALVAGASLLLLAAGTGTFERTIDAEGGELGGRPWLFQRTLAAIADRPLAGHGAGAFESYFQSYKNAEFGGVYAISKAHNSYLEFAADAGIPALVLLVLALSWLALACLYGVRARRQDAAYPAIGFAAATVVGLHALVDFSIQIPAVAATFAIVIGIGYAQAFPTGGGRHNRL
ncbi:MAG: O-antigen ligase family protein [Pseudomonadota bacterium]|nr:O-antigen ligase family protein [Pseudomonadota bacterium]